MVMSWTTVILLALGLFCSGLGIGIVGTVFYFRRWRKAVIAKIQQYKDIAQKMELAYKAQAKVNKPGQLEKE